MVNASQVYISTGNLSKKTPMLHDFQDMVGSRGARFSMAIWTDLRVCTREGVYGM